MRTRSTPTAALSSVTSNQERQRCWRAAVDRFGPTDRQVPPRAAGERTTATQSGPGRRVQADPAFARRHEGRLAEGFPFVSARGLREFRVRRGDEDRCRPDAAKGETLMGGDAVLAVGHARLRPSASWSGTPAARAGHEGPYRPSPTAIRPSAPSRATSGRPPRSSRRRRMRGREIEGRDGERTSSKARATGERPSRPIRGHRLSLAGLRRRPQPRCQPSRLCYRVRSAKRQVLHAAEQAQLRPGDHR